MFIFANVCFSLIQPPVQICPIVRVWNIDTFSPLVRPGLAICGHSHLWPLGEVNRGQASQVWLLFQMGRERLSHSLCKGQTFARNPMLEWQIWALQIILNSGKSFQTPLNFSLPFPIIGISIFAMCFKRLDCLRGTQTNGYHFVAYC